MRWTAAALAGIVLCVGCGPSIPTSVVVPKDPTPLAKCKVAKSSASPLVTEWPASEKAHLESLLEDRTVVVNYSGCEMRILDGCRLEGRYEWKRTTLAEDVIEIRDESELYAKVPLGAASLEGELESSGRLAIHVTVAGQLRLSEDSIRELPDTAGCKGATHLISALSVGSFELKSGGLVGASGGVKVGGAGVGARHKSEESLVRAAGDPEACQTNSSEKPDRDCASPLQVFLVPLENAVDPETNEADVAQIPMPKPTSKPQRWDEPSPDKSVEVHFETPAGAEGQRWVLVSPADEVLCALPCVRRVGDRSGLRVQLDAARKEDIQVVKVPRDLGYSPGRKVRAVPDQPASNMIAPGIVLGLSAAATIAGFVMLFSSGDNDQGGCEDNDSESLCAAGATMAGVGLLGVIIGGIYFFAALGRDNEPVLDISLISNDTAGVDVHATPEGIRVRF